MELTKRSSDSIIVDFDNAKRRKRSTVTTFEDLPNEFMYEVFEYLDFHHAFRAFYFLNQRFQCLFDCYNLPIKINISSISKFAYHTLIKYISETHGHRICVFRIANPFAGEMCLSLFCLTSIFKYIQLTTFILIDIESDYIQQVLTYLSGLPLLSSLTIKSSNHTKRQDDIYESIFRLPYLKYCQLSIETRKILLPLHLATPSLSPIEHLVINNKVLWNQLESLLSYVPQLKRLSLGSFDISIPFDIFRRKPKLLTVFNHIKDVSLKINDRDDFEHLEEIIRCYFGQVESLHLIFELDPYSSTFVSEYLNANRWQQLISNYMKNLRIFDFQHQTQSDIDANVRTRYENEINRFNSAFWTDRQWFFDYQYYSLSSFAVAIFYSINPYRAKSYKLCGESKQNVGPCSSQISEVSIQSPKAIEQFVDHFPNVTHLTLSETFTRIINSPLINLNSIISLNQLTKLTIAYQRIPVEQVLQLLSCTSNIQTLTLDFKLSLREKLASIERNQMFQLVSKRNIVTNLSITRDCTLDKIRIFIALFPRVELLNMNVLVKDSESITRFLLSKSNDYTRSLFSIYFSKRGPEIINKLKNLLESEKLLSDYAIKSIGPKLHLWW